MVPRLVQSLWEFFNSILGNSPFAKLLAGLLAIGCLIGLVATLRAAGWGESLTDSPVGKRSGTASALEISIARFFRRITGR